MTLVEPMTLPPLSVIEPTRSAPTEAVLPERMVLASVNVPLALAMPPPGSPVDALPEMVLLVAVRVPVFRIPPPPEDELPETVLLVNVSVPPFRMPPPALPAKLPEMVLPITVNLPPLFRMPPPEPLVVELPEIMQFVTVNVPRFSMPAVPYVDVLPVMAQFCKDNVAGPLLTIAPAELELSFPCVIARLLRATFEGSPRIVKTGKLLLGPPPATVTR